MFLGRNAEHTGFMFHNKLFSFFLSLWKQESNVSRVPVFRQWLCMENKRCCYTDIRKVALFSWDYLKRVEFCSKGRWNDRTLIESGQNHDQIASVGFTVGTVSSFNWRKILPFFFPSLPPDFFPLYTIKNLKVINSQNYQLKNGVWMECSEHITK